MRNRKAFLAKVLAAAIVATTVLPGALTANAATIITTSSKSNAEKTDTWSQEMTAAHLGGEAYWHLQSSATSNNNNNSDYSLATAPAVILDMDQDLTVDAEANTPDTVSVDIYPNGTAANMRFGIMVKYVDATHWAYLNYDVGKWLLEYKCDTINNYPTISELSSATLADNQDTRVTVTYTAADQLDITYTPQGGDTITAVIADDAYDNVLSALEEYAATAGEEGTAAPIRFGFKAGTYSTNVTDVNLKNMELNGKTLMTDSWDWVLEREGQVFEGNDIIGGQDYVVLDASAASETAVSYDTSVEDFENGTISAVVRLTSENQAFALAARYTEDGAVKVGFDGSKWYYTVAGTKTEAADAEAPAADTDYTLSLTVENGILSASVAPVDVEEGQEAQAIVLADAVDVSSAAAGSIALETAAGTALWVRSLNYTKKTASAPTALQAEYDRVLEETGTNNPDNKYYSDKWAIYQTALDAAKEMLDSDEEIKLTDANAKQTALTTAFNGLKLVDGSELQSKYDELAAEEQGLATDESWAAFQDVLSSAKAVLDKIAAKESVASTEVSGAVKDLNSAKDVLVERAATTEEKVDLQAGYDSVKGTANNCYTENSWNSFTAALEAAKNVLESETATNTQVKAALDALNAAYAGLTAKAATTEDLQELLNGYDSVKATANANYTSDSWKTFQDALKNAEAALAKGEDATQFEVQSALKALQDAKAGLKTAPVSVTVAFAQAAYTVDATASVATKVNASAAVTYSSSDTSVATVDANGVVTGVKAGTAVITAAAGSVKATAKVTVTTPKITLTAKSTKLQVKKSTKAIQVETKIATDSVVSWKSSNTKVATVTNAGKVKAKKVGTTKLTVTMKSGATATCTLKVQKAKVVTKSIVVSSTKVTLNAGQSYTINAKRNPITATEKITYTTSKKKVATVSNKGVITAKAKGTSKITVKCNGKKKVITVTVK